MPPGKHHQFLKEGDLFHQGEEAHVHDFLDQLHST